MVLIVDDPDPSFTASFEPAGASQHLYMQLQCVVHALTVSLSTCVIVHVELLRQRCAHCHDAIAALECKSCDRAFCAACESHVHAALHDQQQQMNESVRRERSNKEREDEESKGEQRAHHTHVAAINCTLFVVAFPVCLRWYIACIAMETDTIGDVSYEFEC